MERRRGGGKRAEKAAAASGGKGGKGCIESGGGGWEGKRGDRPWRWHQRRWLLLLLLSWVGGGHTYGLTRRARVSLFPDLDGKRREKEKEEEEEERGDAVWRRRCRRPWHQRKKPLGARCDGNRW